MSQNKNSKEEQKVEKHKIPVVLSSMPGDFEEVYSVKNWVPKIPEYRIKADLLTPGIIMYLNEHGYKVRFVHGKDRKEVHITVGEK